MAGPTPQPGELDGAISFLIWGAVGVLIWISVLIAVLSSIGD